MIAKPHIKIFGRGCVVAFVFKARGDRYPYVKARAARRGPLFWKRARAACLIASGDERAVAEFENVRLMVTNRQIAEFWHNDR